MLAEAHSTPLFLIVDDDPLITRLCNRLIHKLGATALQAETESAAIQHFTTHHSELTAVLLDLHLGDSDGQRILEACHAIDADVPFIIMSGYPEPLIRERFEASNVIKPSAYLAKPFRSKNALDLLDGFMR